MYRILIQFDLLILTSTRLQALLGRSLLQLRPQPSLDPLLIANR